MLLFIAFALLLPMIGFLALISFSSTLNRTFVQFIACGTILFSFSCYVIATVIYKESQAASLHFVLMPWIETSALKANFSLTIDSLSLWMSLLITGVGFLIHLYSIGYTDHEKSYVRYFACLNFFIFAMLVLVLAGDLLLLFIGWEGVGLASYLLIGFWYDKPSAMQAAKKAFVINRIGDLGLLLGILLTYYLFGTSDISAFTELAKQQFAIGAPVVTILTVLYFVGATGKSAQIPLLTWLPDAMEGPTPVSALIHAATMVTAGIYLIIRLQDLFILSPLTMQIIAYIGAATTLFASICALAQTELKRVLAYSTVSQLGLMFLACGTGAFYSALFHLTTHAFIKALLFLSAGNLVHLLHGITDMNQMGGLAKIFNRTSQLFFVGVLALSGIPPLAAFFSKDLILEHVHLAGFHALFYIGLISSILTAFYLTRAYCLTFLGASHVPPTLASQASEAPWIMLGPIFILAILAVFGGFLGYSFDQYPFFEKFLFPTVQANGIEQELKSGFAITKETWIAVGGAIFGLISAAYFYILKKNSLKPTIEIIKKAFYLNEIYWFLVGLPFKKLANGIAYLVEPRVFDQSLQVVNTCVDQTAGILKILQSGQIRSYTAWMVLGAALLIVFLAL